MHRFLETNRRKEGFSHIVSLLQLNILKKSGVPFWKEGTRPHTSGATTTFPPSWLEFLEEDAMATGSRYVLPGPMLYEGVNVMRNSSSSNRTDWFFSCMQWCSTYFLMRSGCKAQRTLPHIVKQCNSLTCNYMLLNTTRIQWYSWRLNFKLKI